MIKTTKFLLTFTLCSFILLGCRNNSEIQSKDNEKIKEKTKSEIAVKPETAVINIDGMTCEVGCARIIETKISKMNGVQEVKVDFKKKEALVNYDASVLSLDKLMKEIESVGDGNTYKASESKP